MKVRFFLPAFVLLLSLTFVASGQETLKSGDTLQIVKKLTGQSRKTWIPAGTIEATHREHREPKTTDAITIRDEIDKQVKDYQNNPSKVELTNDLQKMKLDAIPFNVRYKLANAYTMDCKEVVKYDGEKFYWETRVDSRYDSVTPDATLAGNFMTEQFNLNFNRKRICAWDSYEYVTYTASGKFATVDAAGRLPRAVNGPLTAGLIPWGYGRFDETNLSMATISGTEQSLSGKAQVQMRVNWPDGSSASLTLDPALNYAVTACTLPIDKSTVSVNSYGNYRLVAGCWVPATIFMERRDAVTGKVLGSDLWTFTRIDGTMPRPDSFAVQYELNTKIQYIPNLTTEPILYFYLDSMDMDGLLAERLAYMATEGRVPQNCATAAVGYVASRLGKTVPSGRLTSLVGPDGQTTLRDVKQLIQDLGLHCRAIRTDDPATLRSLGPAKAILHVPEKNHVVVVDSADDQHVQIVDVSDSKFSYVQDTDSFSRVWSQGLALLVSSAPIPEVYMSVDDARLYAAIGQTGWSCTKVAQSTYWYYCTEFCGGYFTYYWKRYICEPSQNGTCDEDAYVRYQDSECIVDPISGCGLTGVWYYNYMIACR